MYVSVHLYTGRHAVWSVPHPCHTPGVRSPTISRLGADYRHNECASQDWTHSVSTGIEPRTQARMCAGPGPPRHTSKRWPRTAAQGHLIVQVVVLPVSYSHSCSHSHSPTSLYTELVCSVSVVVSFSIQSRRPFSIQHRPCLG